MKTAKILSSLWLAAWFLPSMLAVIFDFAGAHDLPRTLRGVSALHPFGFDVFGRDALALTLRASGVSLLFASGAVIVALALGSTLGTGIALLPAWGNRLALRLLDGVLAFPYLLIALAWAAIEGPRWSTLAGALLIGTVPTLVRYVCARARELMAEDYVAAARGLGASPARIARVHLMPEILDFCRIKIPNLFAQALVAEATLSFLGVGAPAGRDTWGSLLAQGKDYLIEAPHIALGCGIPLVLTLLAVQIFSEKRPSV